MSDTYYFNITQDGATFLTFDPNDPSTDLITLQMSPLLNSLDPAAKGQVWYTTTDDYDNLQIFCPLNAIAGGTNRVGRLCAATSANSNVLVSTQEIENLPYHWSLTEEGYLEFHHNDYVVGPEKPQLYAVIKNGQVVMGTTGEKWERPATRLMIANMAYGFSPNEAPEKDLTSVAGAAPTLSEEETAVGQNWKVQHADTFAGNFVQAQIKNDNDKWLAGSGPGMLSMSNTQPTSAWTVKDNGDGTCYIQCIADNLTTAHYLTYMDDGKVDIKEVTGSTPASKQKWKFSSTKGKGINDALD